MKLADISVKYPVFATMMIAFLVVVGLMSYFTLGLDTYPKVDFPTVTITTSLKGASPEEIETQITKPVEEVVNTISGIDELRSTTVEGVSHVFVTFLLEKDIDVAAQEVRERVATIVSQFPKDTDSPVIQKMDPDAAPVMAIVVSGNRSAREVTELAKKKIKESLETVNGVGSITMVGGREREIQVTVDINRLNAYGLGIDQVARAIGAQNVEVPGGRITHGEREMVLRTMGRINTVEGFNNVIVANVSGVPIRLSDVGKVEDTFEEPRTISRLDGENAVSLLVRRQSGTNTVKVINTIKKKMDVLKETLPSDIKMEVVRDRSRFIQKSYNEVMDHLILGGLLASIVVLVFMRNWRSTIIAAISIPASIIATFTVIKFLGFTLNNMTMLALAICTGIVIDDAIIVIENIFRYIEEKGYTPMEAAKAATSEIGMAVMATTLSLVVIFLPVAFMPGLPGRFFFSFGITATFAIMISLLIAFSLTPMLASRFLKASGHKVSKESIFYSAIDRWYGVMLKWSISHRLVMVILGVVIFSTVFYIFPRVGKELVVDDDQSEFEIVIETPEGSSLEKTDRILRGIEDEVRKLPGVAHAFTTIGAGETASVTNAAIYLAMVPLNERKISQQDSMKEARKLLKKYPELRVSVQNIGMISGGGFRQTPVNLVLRGPDLKQLDIYAKDIVDYARTVPGMVDVDTSLAVRKPEVRVEIDRDRASELGVTIDSLSSSLRTMVGGEEVTKFKEGDEQYPVTVRLMDDYRRDPGVVSRLTVSSLRGTPVRLDNFVKLEEEKSPAQIDRQDREKQVTIMSNLEGMALGEAVTKLQKKIDTMNLPQDYSTVFIGRAKTMNQAMLGFTMATILSMIFIYMVLASQFNSFVHPFTIMACLPISLPFGLFALLATGKTLNVYSMIGVLMLFGIIKKNSILQVDYTNTLREQGVPRDEAIIRANHVRLRPILMTTISIVFGMLPIALGKGDGSASRASMAMVMVGGQTLSLLITLLITPVVYSLFDDLININWRRFFTMRSSLAKTILVPVFIISLYLSHGFAEERKPLSLDECIAIALEKHPSLRASQSDIAVADEQYKESRSAYYPKASIDASYARSEAKALSFIPGETETYQTVFKVDQKIYDFGRTGGSVDAARSTVAAREWDLSKTKIEIVYNVKESYYSVFKATGFMKVQEASVVQAEAHLRQAKGFYEAGAKAKFDVTNAEVELNQARLELIRARNAFNTALASLKTRIGLDQSLDLEISVSLPSAPHGLNLEQVLSEALKRRPEIQNIDARIKGGEATLKAARGGYYPNLNASGSYGYYDQYPAGQGEDLFQEKNKRWNVGLSLNIPIFEGFVTQRKVSESVAVIESLNAQKEALSNNVSLEVTQAYLELQNAEALISLAESGLNKAKENLDLANGRYDAGVGTIIEVTDAQSSHIRAETDLVNARYDVAIARAKLERAVGLP